jgi:hypothetical protein
MDSLNWRDALAEILPASVPYGPPDREEAERRWIQKLHCDMQRACNADEVWRINYPSRPTCPVVLCWRRQTVEAFNQWSSAEAAKRKKQAGRGLESHSICRFPRRPTLSQYDNARSGPILDRYYFGIYAGQYE